jgi:hypothetical protein
MRVGTACWAHRGRRPPSLRAPTCRPSACCELRMNAACACPRTLRSSPSTAPRSRSSPGHPSPWWPSRSRRWPEWPSSSYSTNNGPRAIRPLTDILSSPVLRLPARAAGRSLAGTRLRWRGGHAAPRKTSHDPTLGAVRSRAVDRCGRRTPQSRMVVRTRLAGLSPVRRSAAAHRGTPNVPAIRARRVGEAGHRSRPGARAFGADQPGPLRAAYPPHGANPRGR